MPRREPQSQKQMLTVNSKLINAWGKKEFETVLSVDDHLQYIDRTVTVRELGVRECVSYCN